jgi:HSP20 family molecular chaperone IbpA
MKDRNKAVVFVLVGVLLGALLVGGFDRVFSAQVTARGFSGEGPARAMAEDQARLDLLLRNQEQLFKSFDSFFDDSFFRQNDPFEEMRKLRRRLGSQGTKRGGGVLSSPFDSWFEDRFGGGSVNDISKREDEHYVYYDIRLQGVSGASVKTKVENGYLTITGEMKQQDGPSEGGGVRSLIQSSFSRVFPLPPGVDAGKLEMLSGKDVITLKFPKEAR